MVKYVPEQGDIVVLNFDPQSGHWSKKWKYYSFYYGRTDEINRLQFKKYKIYWKSKSKNYKPNIRDNW